MFAIALSLLCLCGCHTRCVSTHSSISSFSLSHKRTHLDANIHSVHICIHTTLVPLCLFIPHIMPCISSIVFVFCHSVSLTLASSLSLFFVSFPHFFFLHFALSCSLMRKWLVLEECFLALRRDNKPICYTTVATAVADQCQVSKTLPGKKKKSHQICSCAIKVLRRGTCLTAQLLLRRLCIREQHIVMKSHKYFPSISDKQFFSH